VADWLPIEDFMEVSIAAFKALKDWQAMMLVWYVVGLACSLFWPLYYWKGMLHNGNSWPSFFKGWPFVALFGPLAIIAGFPL
jgi:hypothetical protein